MPKIIEIIKIYPESFRANIYNMKPFRMVGLIDASIKYSDGIERVTLAFYRSSGTNSGKIKGLWYPIVGIKVLDGPFTELTDYLNFVLSNTTRSHGARRGWLAKSLFFARRASTNGRIRGFSNGKHYDFLLNTGKLLRDLYLEKNFYYMRSLNSIAINRIITSKEIYRGNKYSQRENYERFISDIFRDYKRVEG